MDMIIEDFPLPTGPSIPMRLPFLTSMLISDKIKLFSPPHVLVSCVILRATVDTAALIIAGQLIMIANHL